LISGSLLTLAGLAPWRLNFRNGEKRKSGNRQGAKFAKTKAEKVIHRLHR